MDANERKLWHSHDYEVKSGTLVAPGVPVAAEHGVMEQLVGTYGKTWHTWPASGRSSLPLGVPVLMAGFTADGQIEPDETVIYPLRRSRTNRSAVAYAVLEPSARE